MKMTRILYGSDFHGSEAVYRKFLASGLQYKVNALMVGGDVTVRTSRNSGASSSAPSTSSPRGTTST